MSSPGRPASSTTIVSGIARAATSRWAWTIRGRPPSSVLVVLLDAVLADAVAVDEAEEVGGERRVGPAALVRVDPDGLRLEEHRLDLLACRGRPDPVGGLPVEAVGEDDVLLVGRHPGLQELRLVVARAGAGVMSSVGHLPAPSRAQLRRHRREPLAVDGRGQDDDPAPVVDVAAPAGRLLAHRRLGERLRREPVALDDLPVREARQQRRPDHREGDEQEQEAAPRIRATEHRSMRSVSGRSGRVARRAGRGRRRGTSCGSPARGRAG